MTADDFEGDVQRVATEWAYVQSVETADKTDHTIKMRLHVATDGFIQVYANTQKQIFSYALVLNRSRIFGRDCEGGQWHRHPHQASNKHDLSPEGRRPVTLSEFLSEAQQVLQAEGLL